MPVPIDTLSPLVRMGIAAGSAGLVVLTTVPLVEWAAQNGGWVARPSSKRWHRKTTPHLGGIAIVAGIAIALVLAGGWRTFEAPVWIGVGLLFTAGLADDLWGLRPSAKLGAQLVAAVLVVASGLFFWPAGPTWVSGPLTVLWVLGVTNALNLLDAMDGVAAGVSILAAAAFGGVAYLEGALPLSIIAGILAVATAGFLPYNFSSARIFMGDCGSLPLGYLLAALGLGVQGGRASPSVLVPILVLSVPLFDTAFVSITRLRRGQSVAEGGTDHTMHRLVRLGFSERQVALLFYGAGALCGGVGLVGQVGPASLFYALALGIGVAALSVGGLLGRQTGPGLDGMPGPLGGRRTDGDREKKHPGKERIGTSGDTKDGKATGSR